MDITSTLRALAALCSTSARQASTTCPAVLLRLEQLCLALFIAIGKLVARSSDPRLVLAHAQLVEDFAQQVHHEQLSLAVQAEATGAHSLSLQTYDALREPEYDFASEPERSTGRSCYQDAPDVLSGWLGIDYHEARQRVDDAHLLLARRTPDGSRTTPRFTHLAGLYASGTVDRRVIARVARRLEKFEPEDTVFDGIPCPPTATAADGRLLEAHAAEALEQLGRKEASKRIGTLVKDFQERTKISNPPPVGLFVGRERDGVQEFIMRTKGADTEMVLSVIAAGDDPRTQAGKAARLSQEQREARGQQDPDSDVTETYEATPEAATDSEGTEAEQTNGPTPSWLRSDQPMPDWAQPGEASPDEAPPATETTTAATTPAPPEGTVIITEPDGTLVSVAQRRLNVLMDILAAPASGGTIKPVIPTIVVYMWLKELQDLANARAITANGVRLTPGELRRLLAASKIIPIVLGGNSQPLDVGRANRFHQGAIRTAIMARDRGCILPDCTTPPNLVEIDHYQRAWADGGGTSTTNGAAICKGGHQQRHAGQIKIIDINGLAHALLPKHLDPEQIPRRNTYWGALQLGDAERAAAERAAKQAASAQAETTPDLPESSGTAPGVGPPEPSEE